MFSRFLPESVEHLLWSNRVLWRFCAVALFHSLNSQLSFPLRNWFQLCWKSKSDSPLLLYRFFLELYEPTVEESNTMLIQIESGLGEENWERTLCLLDNGETVWRNILFLTTGAKNWENSLNKFWLFIYRRLKKKWVVCQSEILNSEERNSSHFHTWKEGNKQKVF